MISFFKDSSFFQANGKGALSMGKWRQAAKESFKLDDNNSKTNTLKWIEGGGSGAKSFDALQLQDDDLLYLFRKATASVARDVDDPFHPSNNSWRIRPAASEDSALLKKRIAGYFKHLALLLKAANELKMEMVYFDFSKGPVKIYNGGIGIVPYGDVAAEWKACFFDDANARQAHGLFDNYLRTNRYHGASVGNWIEDDYQILLSMYNDFVHP